MIWTQIWLCYMICWYLYQGTNRPRLMITRHDLKMTDALNLGNRYRVSWSAEHCVWHNFFLILPSLEHPTWKRTFDGFLLQTGDRISFRARYWIRRFLDRQHPEHIMLPRSLIIGQSQTLSHHSVMVRVHDITLPLISPRSTIPFYNLN